MSDDVPTGDGDEEEAPPSRTSELLAALVLGVCGLAFAAQASLYGLGEMQQMGPGTFPALLGLALAGISAAIALPALLSPRPDRAAGQPGRAKIAWRPILLVAAAVAAFALTLPAFGLVPASVVTAAIAGLAAERPRVGTVLAASVVAALLTALAFLVMLRLPIPAFRIPS